MDLIPEELRLNIPQLDEASTEPDPMVWVKLLCEAVGWTGYVIEMSRPVASLWRADDIAFFGWVVFWDEELKYFTLSDVEILPGTVTRDATFTPCRLSAVMAQERGDRKFPLGQLVATPGAVEAFARNNQEPTEFLRRHWRGDWGTLDGEDVAENELSLVHSFRLLSRYILNDGTAIYIITEADRSATTMLLPSEY